MMAPAQQATVSREKSDEHNSSVAGESILALQTNPNPQINLN
jgi:hypothetical protein